MEKSLGKVSVLGGKILVALPAIVFGMFHFMKADMMVGMVPVPGGVFWVYATGLFMIAGAVGIFVQKFSVLAAFLLGILFLLFALTIHLPAAMSGNQNEMMTLLKVLGMAGGAWAVSALSAKE